MEDPDECDRVMEMLFSYTHSQDEPLHLYEIYGDTIYHSAPQQFVDLLSYKECRTIHHDSRDTSANKILLYPEEFQDCEDMVS